VLWQLRHLLGESIHQGLAYAEGRKVGLGHKAIVLFLLLVPHGDCPACGEVKSAGLVFHLGLEGGLRGTEKKENQKKEIQKGSVAQTNGLHI
jgi:hypothetical protein